MKKKNLTMLGIFVALCMTMSACGNVGTASTNSQVESKVEVQVHVDSKQEETNQEETNQEEVKTKTSDEDIEVVKTVAEDYGYAEDENGNLVIMEYRNKDYEAIEIPEEINGKKVVKIADKAFVNHSEIKVLIMPDSIIEIGDNSFLNCDGLRQVKFSNNLEKLGKSSFPSGHMEFMDLPESLTVIEEGILSAKKVRIPSGLTELPLGFMLRAELESVTIPSNIKVIGEEAFKRCDELKEVVMEEGVETISKYAFRECEALETIVMPSSLRVISDYAFADCTSLKEVVIPEGITDIGRCAFAGCTQLENIYIPASATNLGYIGMEYTTVIHAPAGSAAEAFANEEGYEFQAE